MKSSRRRHHEVEIGLAGIAHRNGELHYRGSLQPRVQVGRRRRGLMAQAPVGIASGIENAALGARFERAGEIGKVADTL